MAARSLADPSSKGGVMGFELPSFRRKKPSESEMPPEKTDVQANENALAFGELQSRFKDLTLIMGGAIQAQSERSIVYWLQEFCRQASEAIVEAGLFADMIAGPTEDQLDGLGAGENDNG